MKLLFVFSIICLLGLHKTWGQKQNLQYSIARLIVTECLKEFEASNEKIENFKAKDQRKMSNNDATCLYACGFRKLSEENGLTLYKGFLKMIDEVYESGFHVTKFTRADIISQVERCSVKESNDCEFSKCVGIFGPPFIDVYLHYITKY